MENENETENQSATNPDPTTESNVEKVDTNPRGPKKLTLDRETLLVLTSATPSAGLVGDTTNDPNKMTNTCVSNNEDACLTK